MSTILGPFRISDVDDTGTTEYYGFLDQRRNWYILCVDTGAETYRYARGRGDYDTAWTGRAGLSYGLYSDVF